MELYKDDRSGFSYRVPEGTDIDMFRAAIENLPGQESPEIFGLHPNADLTFRTLQVRGMESGAVKNWYVLNKLNEKMWHILSNADEKQHLS